MSEPVIALDHVSFAYEQTPVLRDVTLHVARGDFLAIIGPNGGGKSTLLKLCLDLLRPDTGTVRIAGQAPASGKRLLGYVPQDVNTNKDFPISVWDVALTGRLGVAGRAWRYADADRAAARQALETMEVWDLRDKRLASLSGGQRQRVLVARALASAPQALLLDEPISSIDAAGQERFFELLRHLRETITIVLVTHDVGVISHYVSAVACINQTLHHHQGSSVSAEMVATMYGHAHDVLAHALPRRVLEPHTHNGEERH